MIKVVFGVGIRKASSAVVLALVGAALPALACASPSNTLRNVTISSGEGGVRVALETSSRTQTSLFTLENPDRVVIDLRDTGKVKGLRMPAGIGPVDVIRTGVRPGDGYRIVIELKSSTRARGEWQPAFADVGDSYVVAIGTKAFVAAAFSPTGKVASSSAQDNGAQYSSAQDNSPVTAASVAAPAVSRTTRPPAATRVPRDESTSSALASSAAEGITPKTVRPQHAPRDGDRDIIVAVDAGHGGQDPGAIGRNGTMEKNVVLAIARALAARIDAEPGMRSYLVRDDDYFVVLRDRMVRARNAKADIFVSVHADSIRDRNITGASVYVLSEHGASSEAARWLAERENAADLVGGVKLDDKDKSLASVLLDLTQTANTSASMTAAERVLISLDRTVNVRKSKVQQAGLLVLKSPDIPSMLVETAYISNPGEESRLKSVTHQTKLAEAIFGGIRGYFEVNPPPGTRFAQLRRSQLAGVMTAPTTP
jgi:N-acetylmuramoyl-L-alanine amidase